VVIGADAIILPGLTIGQYAMVGVRAVVTRDVLPCAKVVGNPARIVGYDKSRQHLLLLIDSRKDLESQSIKTGVRSMKLYELTLISDLRGSLTMAQYADSLPFIPKRVFLVFDVPGKEVRGKHAHRSCHQFLMCVTGSCTVLAEDGNNRVEFVLDRPNLGLYLPPMVWGFQYKYSPDAVLMVLASDVYDANDYIHDYDLFLKELKTNNE